MVLTLLWTVFHMATNSTRSAPYSEGCSWLLRFGDRVRREGLWLLHMYLYLLDADTSPPDLGLHSVKRGVRCSRLCCVQAGRKQPCTDLM